MSALTLITWLALLLLGGDAVGLGSVAGCYSFGDGFTYQTLTIRADGRFRSENGGCLGV